MDGRDVYNITAPFDFMGIPTIAGRVEKRSEELSAIHLFQEKGNHWTPLPPYASFAGLQDPCITRIDGKLLLGGVRFPVTCGEDTQAWQMEFHLANDLGEFTHAWTGPPKNEGYSIPPTGERGNFNPYPASGKSGGTGQNRVLPDSKPSILKSGQTGRNSPTRFVPRRTMGRRKRGPFAVQRSDRCARSYCPVWGKRREALSLDGLCS